MIQSFKDKEAEKIYNGKRSGKLPGEIQEVARRKLKMLDAAVTPEDLRIPPGNRFEALNGRPGFYSIRINIRQNTVLFNPFFQHKAGNIFFHNFGIDVRKIILCNMKDPNICALRTACRLADKLFLTLAEYFKILKRHFRSI